MDDEILEPITEVITGNENIIRKTLETYSWMKYSLDSSIDYTGPAILLYEPVWTSLLNLKKRGIKIRCVTEVKSENIVYCKKIQKICDLRHLDGVRTNFGIADNKLVLLAGISQEKDPLSLAILTKGKGFVDAHMYMFENLWEKSILAEIKIKEIENGIKPEIIQTITDPVKINNMYQDLITSSKKELLLIIPIIKILENLDNVGILQLIKFISTKIDMNNNLKIRIIASINNYDNLLEKKIQDLLLYLPLSITIEYRIIEVDLNTKSVIVLADRKESLVIEIKDDAKDVFKNAIGFATYSNSQSTVLSYISIFESFWKQSDLVKKLKDSEELQKDFIQIAAHELKNPIQSILTSSEILKSRLEDKEIYAIVEIISRNAHKLKQLTNDLLDVTKIETKNFRLNKNMFDLKELILNTICDFKKQIDNDKVYLLYNQFENYRMNSSPKNMQGDVSDVFVPGESLIIHGDMDKISQVLYNLLNNAIKFTTKGFIVIETKKNENKKILITIKDSGSGIDPDILPKLFRKFVSKSYQGTGLGLYISKNIIESHGGNIWAENNIDKDGATFSFTLPPYN
ncbi:MAG TPA: HAMP domain-containing sensor histidine kinase [Candidatus Nitrosocosmicus sp.]